LKCNAVTKCDFSLTMSAVHLCVHIFKFGGFTKIYEISGFCYSSGMLQREVGNWLPMFCDSISVPSSCTAWPLKIGLTHCPKTSITSYQPTLHNIPESEDFNKIYQHFQILVKMTQNSRHLLCIMERLCCLFLIIETANNLNITSEHDQL